MSKLQNLQVYHKPQKFISFKGAVLEVNEDVLSELRGLSCHLVVETVIGSYRTGKSWILNQLAGCGVQDGFGVDDGQSPVTNGIWILCRNHPEKENCVIVFLDTEGLHDPFKTDTNNDDSRLFIVSFLLSDTFIYNVMNILSDHDLEKTGFIMKICKDVLESEAKKTFPKFVLLIRDAHNLKLEGVPLKPIEYFEKVLTSGDQNNADLSPKKCIRQHCTKRTCFTLPQPTEFEDLENLGKTDELEMKPKFIEEFATFKEYLLKSADVKRFMNGSPYTTSAFCEFIHEVVAFVSNNKIPQIESLQQRIARDENKRIWQQTTAEFQRVLRDQDKIPLYGRLQEMYSTLKANCLQQLRMQLIPLSERDLPETLEKFKNFAKEEFHSLSRELCTDILEGHLEPLFDMVKDKVYKSPNAVKKFQADVKRVQCIYEKKENLGPEKIPIWGNKEKEIRRKEKELEMQDLQYQLSATSAKEKAEREKIERRLNEIKQELAEERIQNEKREQELEKKRRRDAIELEQMRLKDERELKKLGQENEQVLELMKEQQRRVEAERRDLAMEKVAIVDTLKEMKKIEAEVAEDTNNANVHIAAIEGITNIGVAFFDACSGR